MIALIMAGGAGTRFWPMSRNKHPKQFLKVAGQRSMLQLTVDRLLPVMPITDVYIVTAASQVPLVQEHLPTLPHRNIIIEPFGMNTAPCIALSVRDRFDLALPVMRANSSREPGALSAMTRSSRMVQAKVAMATHSTAMRITSHGCAGGATGSRRCTKGGTHRVPTAAASR